MGGKTEEEEVNKIKEEEEGGGTKGEELELKEEETVGTKG